MHGTANPETRWFESSSMLQEIVLRKCGREVYYNSLENCRVKRLREFESHRFRQNSS